MSSSGRGRGSPRRRQQQQQQQQTGEQPPHGPQPQQSATTQRIGGYMQQHQYTSQLPSPPHGQQQPQYQYPRLSYPQHLQQSAGHPPHVYSQHQLPQPQQASPYRDVPPGGMQQMHLSPVRNPYRHGDMMSGSLGISAGTGISGMSNQPSYIQPRPGRLPKDRPIVKLSVSLIDTYKEINRVYYRERESRRAARQVAQQQHQVSASTSASQPTTQQGPGTQNHGWDDDNFDYIITPNEVIMNRYVLQKRIGKGSFGQVVQALDKNTNTEVAIKIIKSKKPFLMQARTEIELLTLLNTNVPEDQNNIVRLLTHFMYRNHQCLVFEMLSLNLYELLKNTHFAGVSLNLIRKFAKQILKALAYLASPKIDVIHCDLKPENILLRHPKRSGIKVIDFGSSCKSSQRMYSYIQSRFYRSPEVMLGLPYNVAIDMWSLGCILVEMHTGEPLFSGTDQFDQMQKIVATLGLIPDDMLDSTDDQHRGHFFEQQEGRWVLKQTADGTPLPASSTPILPSLDPISSLKEVVSKEASQKKKFSPGDPDQTARSYHWFVDLIYRMLTYRPSERITPSQALDHPFITNQIQGVLS